MINTSNEYKQVIRGDDRVFYGSASITLADSTVLNLDNSNIKGISIDDATSQTNQFTLGSAIINKLTLRINNIDDDFSDYDFANAVIRPSVGLQLSSTIETLKKGVFTAEDPKVIGSTIAITAYDNMAKFDRPFKDVAQAFPINAGVLLSTVCNHCGVILTTTSFTNSNYMINERPFDDAISCREIVSWIAAISGNFARCNTSGALELKWYDIGAFEIGNADGGVFDSASPYASGDNVDGGNFTDYNSGANTDGGTFLEAKRYHHIYSHYSNPTIATDDVVITGIQVTDSSETSNTVLFGSMGYIISITGNKLIQSQSDASHIANTVGAKIVGMRFRPLSATVRSDPSVEAGDVDYVSTRKGNVYQSLVTHVNFGINQSMKISCEAETPARNSSTRYSETAKVVIEARKETQAKLTAYDLMVQQLNDLVAHSFGVYKSEEALPDGSIIYYMHDKPTRAESMKIWKQTSDAFAVSTDGGQTYQAGFDVNGNAVVNVLSAIGVNANWIRTGKLLSNDGETLIDMAYGVANSDNFSYIDNIQDGYPLSMPFNIDDSVSKINKVLLKFTQQKFRTYSKTASSGGGASTTSASGGNATQTSSTQTGEIRSTSNAGGHSHSAASGGYINLTTNQVAPPSGTPHSHTVTGGVDVSTSLGSVSDHSHTVNWPSHNHEVAIPAHTHGVEIPSHTHNLDFGIQETNITNNEIKIYVDGTLRATTSNLQDIVDLTAWVTTVGWHTIEVRSTTLKRISAQINIKSYIRS